MLRRLKAMWGARARIEKLQAESDDQARKYQSAVAQLDTVYGALGVTPVPGHHEDRPPLTGPEWSQLRGRLNNLLMAERTTRSLQKVLQLRATEHFENLSELWTATEDPEND